MVSKQAPSFVGYDFDPLAMLPAWVVVDANLVVRNHNPFAYDFLVLVQLR